MRSGRGFPYLGRDPAPGDVELTRGVARHIGALSVELGRIGAEIDSANGSEWQGQAAEAFRATLRDELLPLLRKAHDSFDRAGHSLGGWAEALAGFQAEAQALEREAASRQATLDAARRALSYSPSGADTTTLARLDHNVACATAAVAQLEYQADELHDRYLRAASSVAGELEQAGRIGSTEPGDWLERLGESVRSWMETLLAPSDLLAGDQWLELALVKGEKVTEAVENAVEGLPGLIDGWWSEVSALAHEADHGLVPWEDVAVSARRFTAMAQAAKFFTEDWVKRTGWIRGATRIGKNLGRLMGFAGIVGDVFTIWDPPDRGVMGDVDGGIASVNGALVVANMFDEVPVVGQVVMAGTGVYLGGNYAYHHWPWFHDACDTVGHFVADRVTKHVEGEVERALAVAEGVKHAVSSAWHWMTSW